MSWVIWLLISLTISSFQTIFLRSFVKEKDNNPEISAILSNLIGGLFLLLLLGMYKPSLQNLPNMFIPILIANLLYGVGILLAFKALRILEASEYIVLFATRIFWVILVSVLLFGNSFNLSRLFGSLLIFLSVYLISWHGRKISLGRGEVFGLLAAVFFGVGFSIDGFILRSLDVVLYSPISFLLTGTFAALFVPKQLIKIPTFIKGKYFLKVVILSLLFAASNVAFNFALQLSGNAAQISVLNQTQIIIIVISGVVFLKERGDLFKKILAALISFVGVLLVK